MPTNPMVVTLDQFNNMRTYFQQRYFLSGCNTSFGGQDIQIPWSAFSTAVHNFMSASGCVATAVALRFVLCYDPNANALYLRMQICTMAPSGTPNTYNLNTGTCAWYSISDAGLATTTVTDLYDQNYLDYFYYCDSPVCDPSTSINLASDTGATTYVRNVVFPWGQEVQKVFADDGLPTNASICFAAGSYSKVSPSLADPHTLAIYLRDKNGTPLLDNVPYNQPFKNKAADVGTLCPPHCDMYILPS